MTRTIIECVPNFSEGRDRKIIAALAETALSVPNITLLGCSSDADHNRSVITVTGNPESIAEAAFQLCKTAAERIDLRKHTGVHPRMGAADVIPFTPISGATIADCVEISHIVGRRIAKELNIPVYLYEESASSPNRKNLAAIRKGGFEGFFEKIKSAGWEPDFGEKTVHESAGVTAVGARLPLIAFNINLNTQDAEIAKKIAAKVRESGGGLKCLKALGVSLNAKGAAQVSMNLTNYAVTSLFTAYNCVKEEAEKLGVSIAESEIIGFAPARALAEAAAGCLLIKDFSYNSHVLESRGICVDSISNMV